MLQSHNDNNTSKISSKFEYKPVINQVLQSHNNANVTCRTGRQSSPDELMYTMPLRDTVAGEALSMLWGSKMILHCGDIGIRSPLARVSVLLSSSTLLRFSIQMASTGPSKTIQIRSPEQDKKSCFTTVERVQLKQGYGYGNSKFWYNKNL